MPGIYGGYDFKMAYKNSAGSRLAQKGGKTYLTPMKEIETPNPVIPDVMETSVASSTGPAISVMPMRGTQGGG